MKDRIRELVESRPEFEHSHSNTSSAVHNLFGDSSDFAIGFGMGNKLGGRPVFKPAGNRFGLSRFVRQRRGV